LGGQISKSKQNPEKENQICPKTRQNAMYTTTMDAQSLIFLRTGLHRVHKQFLVIPSSGFTLSWECCFCLKKLQFQINHDENLQCRERGQSVTVLAKTEKSQCLDSIWSHLPALHFWVLNFTNQKRQVVIVG